MTGLVLGSFLGLIGFLSALFLAPTVLLGVGNPDHHPGRCHVRMHYRGDASNRF